MSSGRRLVACAVAALALSACEEGHPVSEQPLAFNHKIHMDPAKGKTVCTDCHAGAEREARAGLPSIQGCLLCHMKPQGNPPSERESVVRKLANEPQIRFVQVTRNVGHVYFSHRAHVAISRIACLECHGDVTQWTEPPTHPQPRLVSMFACMQCHRERGASNSCSVCHR